MNSTHHDPCDQMINAIVVFSNLFRKYPYYIRTLVIVLYSIVCCFGASGSLLVIAAVLRKPQMRILHNFFIVNLALSDLMLCTFAVPLTAFLTLNAYWIFGEVACKLTSFGSGVNLFVSSMSISAIGMDRYWAILFPTKAYQQRIVAIACFVIIWLISMTLASPQYFMTRLNVKSKCHITLQVCHENWTPYPAWQKSYTIGCMLFQYILPLVMLIFLYGRIIVRLKQRPAVGRTSLGNIRKNRTHALRDKKRNKLLICIVIAFASGWLPFNVFNVLNAFKVLEYEVSLEANAVMGLMSKQHAL
uniref:G-protein coupled receptors family 1 profile domain-containing protein n=1 Tax=Romanomermis culicivorax TaxID=13658 RepID=A0A915J0L0_ROMCU